MSDFVKSLNGFKSPYYNRIPLGAERGDAIIPEDQDAPEIQITENHVTGVKRLNLQVVKVINKETGEQAYVRRIVAELDNGNEMDITDPVSLNAELAETGIDTTKCAACMLPLDAYDVCLHDRKAYHNYCMEEEEKEAPSPMDIIAGLPEDKNKYTVENFRFILNSTYKKIEEICELAVIDGVLHKFVGFKCPNEECNRILFHVPVTEVINNMIWTCSSCQIHGREKYSWMTKELPTVTLYCRTSEVG